jgi:type II secretory pathway pseudopilin PulG
MIVVAIIGLVSMIAIPSFLKARNRSRATRFANDIRVAEQAFSMYNLENGVYPAGLSEDNLGVVPPGMEPYLGKMDWTVTTPLGGEWLWENLAENGEPDEFSISVFDPEYAEAIFEAVDEIMDDGLLYSGRFRREIDEGAGGAMGEPEGEVVDEGTIYTYSMTR